MAALALFGESLKCVALALAGHLAEGVALLQDSDGELELILALFLAALEPAAEYFQKDDASSKVGGGGDDSLGEASRSSRSSRDFRR